jgi:hypothetical protein
MGYLTVWEMKENGETEIQRGLNAGIKPFL